MKWLLLSLSLLIGTNSYAQSMMVLNSGKILTIDDQGMLFDLGNFLAPYQIKAMGGRYLIDDNRKLRTVDKNGFLFNKDQEDKVPGNIEYFGENYFISKSGNMFTVDEQGFLFEAGKEKEFRNILKSGGNFVIAEKKSLFRKDTLALFVITKLGQILEVNVPKLNLEMVNSAGGYYFTTSTGELFTVSTDGFVYSKKELGKFNSSSLKKGLNYFILSNKLYTITQEGILIEAMTSNDLTQVKHLGTNFFVTQDARLFTISTNGSVQVQQLDFKASDISQFSHL